MLEITFEIVVPIVWLIIIHYVSRNLKFIYWQY